MTPEIETLAATIVHDSKQVCDDEEYEQWKHDIGMGATQYLIGQASYYGENDTSPQVKKDILKNINLRLEIDFNQFMELVNLIVEWNG